MTGKQQPPMSEAVAKRYEQSQAGVPLEDEEQALTYVPTRPESRLLAPGELPPVKAEPVTSIATEPYAGVAKEAYSKEAQAILSRPLTDQEIHIRPDDGNLYLPGVYYRRRLNEAFGIGAWGLVPVSQVTERAPGKNPTVFYSARLYVLGRFAAESTGKGTWITENAKSDFGTALESAKTDALTRCGKDLGIAAELWDPDTAGRWRAQHCVKIKNPDTSRFGYKAVEVWVRRDDPCFDQTLAKPAPPPNVPELSHSKETGAPLMGNWPRAVVDPSADGHRELDNELRRIVGAPVPSELEVLLQRSIDDNTIEVENKKTGEFTREPKALQTQIAHIHILQRELGITEESYRHGMKTYYGVETSSVLTKAQANDMILRLERAKARVPPEMLKLVSPTGE